MPNEEPIGDRDRLGIYKMEYEQCVALYRNIYEEIWRIFSYLVAVSAALLVFGREYFSIWVTLSASMFPLAFWFLGIYLPMDRYGNMRLSILGRIEGNLKTKYQIDLIHFSEMKGKDLWPVKHEYGWGWRVRKAVRIFGVTVIVVFFVGLVGAVWTGQWKATKTLGTSAPGVQVTGPSKAGTHTQ